MKKQFFKIISLSGLLASCGVGGDKNITNPSFLQKIDNNQPVNKNDDGGSDLLATVDKAIDFVEKYNFDIDNLEVKEEEKSEKECNICIIGGGLETEESSYNRGNNADTIKTNNYSLYSKIYNHYKKSNNEEEFSNLNFYSIDIHEGKFDKDCYKATLIEPEGGFYKFYLKSHKITQFSNIRFDYLFYDVGVIQHCFRENYGKSRFPDQIWRDLSDDKSVNETINNAAEEMIKKLIDHLNKGKKKFGFYHGRMGDEDNYTMKFLFPKDDLRTMFKDVLACNTYNGTGYESTFVIWQLKHWKSLEPKLLEYFEQYKIGDTEYLSPK